MRQVLVTGADGFVASGLIPLLLERGWGVRGSVIDEAALAAIPKGASGLVSGDLASFCGWGPLLDGIDAVVHLAGKVHAEAARAHDGEAFARDNVESSRRLAEACALRRVARFVFASSAKAIGEETASGQAWDEGTPCSPADPYGRSKLEAERVLAKALARHAAGLVVLRLPLVYGPGMRANMLRLFKAVDAGWPLPLAGIENSRSLLYLGNLADAVALCLDHPAAAGETFHVTDGEDLSTPELARTIARALGRPARLFRVPEALLAATASLAGRASDAGRLTGSLVLDGRKIRLKLGWRPPHSADAGLKATADWFRDMKR
ncbi:MAG: NAD-dependent epimerase/dehydratase family protein [Elusimicrobia bacterium]|nr:NAD-dependent epimerase/dehydratase family protein [Elusimicrobiota bacterium]